MCDGVLNCDLGDHSDEKQCELSFLKSRKFFLILGSCALACLLFILIYVGLQKFDAFRLKSKLNKADSFTNINGKIAQNAYLDNINNKLVIEKKLNKSFTLQSSAIIEEDYKEDLKPSKAQKKQIKPKQSASSSSSSSSSSLSLINKNSFDHYQVETQIPQRTQVHISPRYQPFVSLLKCENDSLAFQNPASVLISSNPQIHSQLTPIHRSPLSLDASDKKSSASNTYAYSQITTDSSLHSQKKHDELYRLHEKSKNKGYFTDDGQSSLRRNSYTKAIFLDNL